MDKKKPLNEQPQKPKHIITHLTDEVKQEIEDYAINNRCTDIDIILDNAFNTVLATENEQIYTLFRGIIEERISTRFINRVIDEVEDLRNEDKLYSKDPSAYYGVSKCL